MIEVDDDNPSNAPEIIPIAMRPVHAAAVKARDEWFAANSALTQTLGRNEIISLQIGLLEGFANASGWFFINGNWIQKEAN